MAYATGTATNANDLLDKLRLFATAQGWTLHQFAARSDGGGAGGMALLLGRNNLHFGLAADLGAGSADHPGQAISVWQYPSYSNAHGNRAQPSRSNDCWTNALGPGPFNAYHFFAGPEYIHCVVEGYQGHYAHFGFGRLKRFGAFETGAYCYGRFWRHGTLHRASVWSDYHGIPFNDNTSQESAGRTILRADFGGVSPRYFYASPDGLERLSRWWRHPFLSDTQASLLTGRAILVPVTLFVTTDSGATWRPVGQAPDFRYVRLDNLAPGQQLTLGGDTWRVFPVMRKPTGDTGEVASGMVGIALRVVP